VKRQTRRSRQSQGTPRPPPARPFLDRHWRTALVVLFVSALVWRLAYLSRLAASPLAGSLHGDERAYWDWATFLLDHGFRGTNPFYQGPLYPYVLALLRTVVGSRVFGVLVVQCLWGSAAAVLLADATKRLTRTAVGLCVGVLLAFYQMSVLFDGLVLMESLLFFLEAALVWLWVRAAEPNARLSRFVGVGLLTGVIAQCRATGALLLVPSLLLAIAERPLVPARVRTRTAAMFGAFLLTMLPTIAWNWSTAHEFIPFSYNFGYNLYVGNNPDANGGFVSIAGLKFTAPAEGVDGSAAMDGREYLQKRRGLSLSPAQSSQYWAGQAIAFAMAHPGTELALVGRKLAMTWSASETPQIESARMFQRVAGPLGLPVAGSFLVLGPLGLAGLVYAGRWKPVGTMLRVSVLLSTAALLPFFVTDRYRFHLIPALAVLAGMALETLLDRSRNQSPSRLRTPALVAAGAIAIVALSTFSRDAALDDWLESRDLGSRWLEQGRADLALAEFHRAARIENALGLDQDPSTRESRALAHFSYGVALRQAGRGGEAIPWLERAVAEDPHDAQYVRTLGDAYLVTGRGREGDSLLQNVGGLPGGDAEALLSRGYQAARAGDMAGAESLLAEATQRDANLTGAWGALIRVQVQRYEDARARQTLARAAKTSMPAHQLHAYEALVDAASGDSLGARRALEQIPAGAAERDPALAQVVAMARRLMLEASR